MKAEPLPSSRTAFEGFIVRGRDPQDIAQAMIRLATDPELNRRMGEAACLKGSLQNSWQDYGDRLLAAYRQQLAARNPVPASQKQIPPG